MNGAQMNKSSLLIQSGNPIKIVMLDDQVEVYERINDSLTRANIHTYFTDDYDQALRYIRKEKPNVILSDIFLGPEDSNGKGLELLNEVVSNADTFYIPVIMYSGDSRRDYSTSQKAYEQGAEAYLRKPHNHSELVATINNAAKRYSSVQTDLSSQFIPKTELRQVFMEVGLTFSLNIALIANQRNGFAAYNYLKRFLGAHAEIYFSIFETAHAFYESVDKSNIEYDAIISCISDLSIDPDIRSQCATLYFFPNYQEIMSQGHCDYYDHYFYWDKPKNPQPLYHQIAVAVRNFRRHFFLQRQLDSPKAIQDF